MQSYWHDQAFLSEAKPVIVRGGKTHASPTICMKTVKAAAPGSSRRSNGGVQKGEKEAVLSIDLKSPIPLSIFSNFD